MRAIDRITIEYGDEHWTFVVERMTRMEFRQLTSAQHRCLEIIEDARENVPDDADKYELKQHVQKTADAFREAQYDLFLPVLARHCMRIEHVAPSAEESLKGYPEGSIAAEDPARLKERVTWLENCVPEDMVFVVVNQACEFRRGRAAALGKYLRSPEQSPVPAPPTPETPSAAGSAPTA